jgi:hypothetical protein
MQTNTTHGTYGDERGEASISWRHPELPSKQWIEGTARRLGRAVKGSSVQFTRQLTVTLKQSLMDGAYWRLYDQFAGRDCAFLMENIQDVFRKEGLLVTLVTLDRGEQDAALDCVKRKATIHVEWL